MIYEDGTYLANNPTWHEEDSAQKAKQVLSMLEKHSIRPKQICDIGCGTGEVLRHIFEHYKGNVICDGYEISSQAFGFCKRKQRDKLRFFHADLLDQDEPEFDVVLALDVFEHVEDYFGFLRKLRKRGIFKVFTIPLDMSVQMVLRRIPIMKVRRSVGHLHYFMKETALATLLDTGYEVLDYVYIQHDTPGWRGKVMRLPRKAFFSIRPDFTVRIFGGYTLLVLSR
jgi:SAM-dependent methyltransferase